MQLGKNFHLWSQSQTEKERKQIVKFDIGD